MTENQLHTNARLNVDLGEPESWLETMLREARRQALHAAAIGDEPLAARWRKVAKGLDYATAATADNPMLAGEPGATSTQSQTQPTSDNAA